VKIVNRTRRKAFLISTAIYLANTIIGAVFPLYPLWLFLVVGIASLPASLFFALSLQLRGAIEKDNLRQAMTALAAIATVTVYAFLALTLMFQSAGLAITNQQ
jgi:hypothetical protein